MSRRSWLSFLIILKDSHSLFHDLQELSDCNLVRDAKQRFEQLSQT